jgi:hypothetical protein
MKMYHTVSPQRTIYNNSNNNKKNIREWREKETFNRNKLINL